MASRIPCCGRSRPTRVPSPTLFVYGALLLTCAAAPVVAQEWRPLGGAVSPLAYDTARRRLVGVGPAHLSSWSPFAPRLAIWEWAGHGWQIMAPIPDLTTALVYDPSRRRTVGFGSTNGRNWFYEWDGSVWHATPVVSPPTGRMVHDELRRRCVLYDGRETWEWDGTTWVRFMVPHPPNRQGHVLTYDRHRGGVLMFGGSADGVGWLPNDLWSWDGSRWRILASGGPASRVNHSLTYDPVRRRSWLIGGQVATGLPDLWSWDGTSWQHVLTLPPLQWWITRHHAVFDEGSGDLLVMDLWNGSLMAFNGSRFREVLPPVGNIRSAALDLTRGHIVALCGHSYRHGASEWDGSHWSPLVPDTDAEPSGHMVTEPGTGRAARLDLDAGATIQLWTGSSWAPVSSANRPPARIAFGVATDLARRRLVLFGGWRPSTRLDDTWEWDGVDWRQLQSTLKPSARSSPQMAFDRNRGVTVLLGGDAGTQLYDTWEWDGTDWILRDAGTVPSQVATSAVVYDAARGRVQRFTSLGTRLEWDGTSWSILFVYAGGPPYVTTPQLVDDVLRGTVFAGVGPGYVGAPTPSRAWQVDVGCGTPPPGLIAAGTPHLGNDHLRIEVVLGRPTVAPLALFLGTRPAATPVAGCTALVVPDALVLLTTDGQGFCAAGLRVPMDLRLEGQLLHMQAAVLDAAQPLGFGLTQRLTLALGR